MDDEFESTAALAATPSRSRPFVTEVVLADVASPNPGIVGLVAVVPFIIGQRRLDVRFGDLGVQILWIQHPRQGGGDRDRASANGSRLGHPAPLTAQRTRLQIHGWDEPGLWAEGTWHAGAPPALATSPRTDLQNERDLA
jgi:hypothetical protein